MWRVPKMWDGGRCFIIGGGSSMPYQFGVPKEIIQKVYSGQLGINAYSPYLSSIHKEHVIAVNMAYQLGDWTDILFWGDDSYFSREKKSLLNYNGLRITCMHKMQVEYSRIVKHVLRDPKKQFGLSVRDNVVVWNKNSGAATINIATLLGVKQIILLGFDMKLDDNQNQHWHKCYKSPVKTVGGTFKMHLRGFPAIAEDAKRLGVEILNCNMDSNIEDFRKVTLKDVL